jgi:carboxyl-terminal processing protease
MSRSTTILLIVIFIVSSCRKHSEKLSDPSEAQFKDFGEVFNAFWNGMNNNYVFWDMDTTNWDNIYAIYAPVFSRLDITKPADRLLAAHYLRQMCSGLLDGHFYLSFSDEDLQDSSFHPADLRLQGRLNYHPRYDPDFFDQVAANYLDSNYVTAGYFASSGDYLNYIAGTIQDSILYFRINAFGMAEAYQLGSDRMRSLLDYFFAASQSAVIKGIIIDVRDNDGGDLRDLNFLVGHFIGSPLVWGTLRYKRDDNPLDFTPWMPAIITPSAGGEVLSKPIMVLANMYSISMAEMTTMSLKTFPNTTVIGERTYGATGMLTSPADLNDGSFTIGDFAVVTETAAAFKYRNDSIYESKGFPPDILVDYDQANASPGKDDILEMAIHQFK